MNSVDAGLEAQIRNIEAQYGKPLSEWIALIQASGKTKHTEIVAWLKSDYGMAHGAAHRVALRARAAGESSIVPESGAAGGDPAADLYSGKKAGLRPIHDALMAAIIALGPDLELAPKSGYVSVRREKQFAMIQPTTATRIDLGLILKDTPPTERLEPAAGFNALFTHRVRISSVPEVDDELRAWLQRAYGEAIQKRGSAARSAP